MKTKKNGKDLRKSVKNLVPLTGIAMKKGFYLEVVMMVSTIMESRFRSVITRIEKENPGLGFNLEKCIRKIKYLRIHQADPLLVRNFDLALIDSLRTWKNHRNGLLKDLTEIHVSKKRIENLAREGIFLLGDLNMSYKKFKAEWKASLQPSSDPVS
jgi:hypothetical protein